ncbi:glycosyltransferase family 2 protein [Xanthobacter variabilis]|uniref:glycosyltransferase family 2 protein n=1 Tax=Xanthobacter variabilis TaxID=3119932 RepID=UPI0037275347
MSATPNVGTPRLTVVFVTYNSGAVIARAVASVPDGCDVIIVDNASPEGTPWRASLPRPAEVVDMGRNAGFGAACNAGARRAATPYVMFLNPDAALAPDAVDQLFEAAGIYGDEAILMPVIIGDNGRLMRKQGTILDQVPRRARLKAGEIAGDYCTGFLHGAAFMMARASFLSLGGFDEAIFLYHEDDDLSLRARARRMPITVVAAAQAVHSGGGSSTPSFAQTFAINRFKQQSERYVRTKYGRGRGIAGMALKLLGGCLLAGLLLNPHRVAVRAGKLRGLFDQIPVPTLK